MRSIWLLALSAALLALPGRTAVAAEDEARHLGRGVAAWRADLSDEASAVRFNALVALGAIGPDAQAALPDVVRLLKDPHPEVQKRVLGTLAHLGPDGYAVIFRTLEHENPLIRSLCCDVLTYTRPPRHAAARALRKHLVDPAPVVRYLAAFALTAVDPHERAVFPVLKAALKTGSNPAVVGACHAIARLRVSPRPLLPALRQALATARDERTLAALGHGLRAMGTPVLPELLRWLDASKNNTRSADRIVLVRVIADLARGDSGTASQLQAHLGSRNPAVAGAVAEALRRIGAASELGGAAPALRDLSAEALAALDEVQADRLRRGVLAARAAVDPRLSPAVIAQFHSAQGSGGHGGQLALVLSAYDLAPVGWAAFRAPTGHPAIALTHAAALFGTYVDAQLRQLERGRPGARDHLRAALVSGLESADAGLGEQARSRLLPWWSQDPEALTRVMHKFEPDPQIHAAMTGALAELLVAALEDQDPWHTASPVAADPQAIAAWRTRGTAAITALERAVAGDGVERSMYARIALAHVEPKRAQRIAGVIEALASEQVAVRRAAAAALATLEPGTPAAVDALANVIRNRNEQAVVRRTAAVALGRQGPAAAETIAKALESAEGAGRRFWLVAWGRAGIPLVRLLPLAQKDLVSPDAGLRAAAIEGVVAMGDAAEALTPALAEGLTHASAARRDAALETLAALGAKAHVPEMIDTILRQPRGARARAGRLLSEMGDKAVDPLVKTLLRPGWERRLIGLNILARIGAPTARRAADIASLLSAPDSSVRVATLGVLEMLGERAAMTAPAVGIQLADPVGRVRASAIRTLVAMGRAARMHRHKFERLAADDPHAFVRAAAAKALSALDKAR